MTDEIKSFLLHPNDKKALDTLQSIPAFTPVVKAFLRVFNEQQLKIMNMSSKVRISPLQLPEIYNLLPPICEKLSIDEPELYLELNRSPNAYTTGDTATSITLTTGLLEYMDLNEISTVIAHECGHIACRHVLYHTMGQMIFTSLAAFTDIGGLLTAGIQTAFSYWMRCSEFSADRASALCSGGAKPVVNVMMRLAGGGKNLPFTINTENFIQQAVEYEKMINTSTWNKTWESILLKDMSHPLLTVRALEISKWCDSTDFANIIEGKNSAAMKEKDEMARYIEQTSEKSKTDIFAKGIGNTSVSSFFGFSGNKKSCICPYCGKNVSADVSYCNNCGNKLR